MREMTLAVRVPSTSFYRWLCEQTRRDDPIGDFARDVGADMAFPKGVRFVGDLDGYIRYCGGSDAVCEAFVRAWREYRRTEGGRTHYRRSVRREFRTAKRVPSMATNSRPSRSLGPLLRALILERDGFRCRRCGNGPNDERLEIDHINPVAHGGGDEPENLQTLCESCNAGKGARDPHPHDLRPFGAP